MRTIKLEVFQNAGSPRAESPLCWTVSQIGARQHYGVPRGFEYRNQLRALYTDSWCRWGSPLLKFGPTFLRAFAGRYHSELVSEHVSAFTIQTQWDRLLRGSVGRGTEAIYNEYLRFGTVFARWVTRDLEKKRLDPDTNGFFGFNTGSLETIEMLNARGVLTVVDQIDPAQAEEELVFQETQRWPDWQIASGRIPKSYFDRLSAEWAAASLVLVNSEWSKTALIRQGVPACKILVVAVAHEAAMVPPAHSEKKSPITVLWLGTVNLRKGIPYLIGAAKLLERSGIRFVVAGPIEISRAALATAPSNMTFLGRVTRDQTNAQYKSADVFVLPTISDGFAITQVEAMSHGLPVITTRNCGEVVTHGIDGLLVPIRDERGLAEAIATLDADRELLRDMSAEALLKASTFHLPRQAEQIEHAIRRFRETGSVEPQAA